MAHTYKARGVFNWWETTPTPPSCTDLIKLTDDSQEQSCNINFIVERYVRTGIPPAYKQGTATYDDFTEAPTFQEALEIIKDAQEQFNGLPAAVRTRFKGDPGEFLAFVANRDNLEEAHDLGLLSKEKSDQVAQARAAKASAKEATPQGNP
ncbi:MAG: internal scaffolding protein [Microvirus sp.]|nr:MAG: internal scaffolding protein [Microvirus sp.]